MIEHKEPIPSRIYNAAVGGHVAGAEDIFDDAMNKDQSTINNELTTAITGKLEASEKGAVNGVASLDGFGKVPSSQLPSYVDDVIEGYFYEGDFYSDAEHTELITPESDKIYIDVVSNKSYRWTGNIYFPINNPFTPDEEDLTVKNDRLKLADKTYDSASFSGMGRVYLRKNMVSNVNTLTQDMFYKGAAGSRTPNTNTIFIIQYDYTLSEDITIPDNCVLYFDGGSIGGAYTITFTDTLLMGKPDIKLNVTCDGTLKNKELHVEWFGAVGDGTYDETLGAQGTDNRQAFVNISTIVSASGGGKVVFERNKIYSASVEHSIRTLERHTQTKICIFRFNLAAAGVTVDMNGSTLQMITNTNNAYNMFIFIGCGNSKLVNGNIIGDGRNHQYVQYVPENHTDTTGTSYEWCYGINNIGSNLTLENINISHCCGDGMYTCSTVIDEVEYAAEVRYDKGEISYCGRQGISISRHKRIEINDVSIHSIGAYLSNPGFNPQSGIDVEFEDSSTVVGDYIFNRINIRATSNECLICNGNSHDMPVNDFIIIDSRFGKRVNTLDLTPEGLCKVINSRCAGVYLNKDTVAVNSTFVLSGAASTFGQITENCIIKPSPTSTTPPSIYGISSDYKMKFINCQISELKGSNETKTGFKEVSSTATLFVEFYNCKINADFFLSGGSESYRELRFYNCVLNDCFIDQGLTNLYAKSCVFNECLTANTGSARKTNITFDSCRLYNENTTLDNTYGWSSILSFGSFNYKFCDIETKQTIWRSNYSTGGSSDKGVYKRCIIDYSVSTAYYGTQKNFTDCTVTGIS